MTYTCQKCGASADTSSSLCNPTAEELGQKFCGSSAAKVCNDKLASMKYSCDACGSVSANSEHLCNPSIMR